MLQIKCPHCGLVHKASSEVAGKQVTCKACKRDFRAPSPPSGPPSVQTGDAAWSLHVDGATLGPFSHDDVAQQIQDGKIDGSTLAWRDGMDDWTALGELAVFSDELSDTRAIQRPAARRGAAGAGRRSTRVGGDDDEHAERPHRHYARGQKKRDTMMGAWIAGVLGVITLVVVLVVVNKKEPVEPPPAAPPMPRAVGQPAGTPGAATPTSPAAKRPMTKRPTVRKMPAEKRLQRVVADLERRFPAIIEAHKAGKPKPIGSFIQYLQAHAKSLREYPWGQHQGRMNAFIARMEEAASGVKATLNERAHGWGLGEGLEPKQRAEALRLNEYEWLQNWVTILRGDIAKLREGGLDF